MLRVLRQRAPALTNPVPCCLAQIEEAMLAIAQALLAVCVCLGCVPVIRFRKGGPGEMIGRHLNTLLREQLSGQNVWVTNAFRNGMFQRPVSLHAMCSPMAVDMLWLTLWLYP